MRSINKMCAVCVATGSAFVVAGLMEAVSAWSAAEWLDPLTAGNVMLGLVLVLAGAVFLSGAREAARGREGEAYIVVGSLIGLFAGIVTLLTMGANGAEHLLGNEDLAGWVALDGFTLAIVMIVPSVLLLRWGLRAFRDAPGAEVPA